MTSERIISAILRIHWVSKILPVLYVVCVCVCVRARVRVHVHACPHAFVFAVCMDHFFGEKLENLISPPAPHHIWYASLKLTQSNT